MSSPRLIYSIYENRLRNKLANESLPKHIGLIHDGHRRYARKEGLLSFEVSYKIGMTRLKECIGWCDEVGIDFITSWLLSRENLSRPQEELEPYFQVLNELFEELLIDDVVDNFKIEFIGSTDLLPDFLQETIKQLKEVRGGGQKTLTIALGYGGRQEILDAILLLAKTEGIFTEPAGGVSVSVLQKMVEQGKIDKNDKVVCYVTGNGLKATESIMQVLPQPTVYKPNINEISAVVQ